MARQNYAKYAIEQYAKRDPDVMLIESKVTDSDLDALEERMGVKLPVELRDYFQSYVVMGPPIEGRYVEEPEQWQFGNLDEDDITAEFLLIQTPPGKELEEFEIASDMYPKAGFVYVASYNEQDELLLDLKSGKIVYLMEGLYSDMGDDDGLDGEKQESIFWKTQRCNLTPLMNY